MRRVNTAMTELNAHQSVGDGAMTEDGEAEAADVSLAC